LITAQHYRQLRLSVMEYLNLSGAVSDEALRQHIEHEMLESTLPLPTEEKRKLVDKVYHSIRGLDVLQPLLDDPDVTEIMVNRHDEIYIEKHGRIYPYADTFENAERLEDIIQAIVGQVNRIVNESTPVVDARLEDGSRVNVVLPPIALDGPAMTIRRFPENPITINELIAFGSLTKEAASLLEILVQAKYNIFISGSTGSGKTTLLNALSNFIPKDERIITIEDSAELQIRSVPNLVRLETRNANTEGRGEITIRDLIRSSLRMRPNRIIVGEVRGGEALDMLQALNTGHDGALSTGHANSTVDMLSRLETMVLSAASLPVEVVRAQISSAIDLLVHLSRMRDRSRKVTEVTEIVGFQHGQIKLNPLFQFIQTESEPGLGQLQRTGSGLQRRDKLEMAGLQSEVVF